MIAAAATRLMKANAQLAMVSCSRPMPNRAPWLTCGVKEPSGASAAYRVSSAKPWSGAAWNSQQRWPSAGASQENTPYFVAWSAARPASASAHKTTR